MAEITEEVSYRMVGTKRVYDMDPDAQLDYPFDFTDYLLKLDDVLASVEFLVDERLDIVAFGHDTTHATVWLRKDVSYVVPVSPARQDYLQVTCRITTNNAPPRVDDRTIYIYFKER